MDGQRREREREKKKGMARSVKATDEIALVAMSQKVSERYLNLKGGKKKIITYRMNKMASVCHFNLHITLETL